jgi:hypothetical protein
MIACDFSVIAIVFAPIARLSSNIAHWTNAALVPLGSFAP